MVNSFQTVFYNFERVGKHCVHIYVWRIIEGLSHCAHATDQAGFEGYDVKFQILTETEIKLDGAFDQITAIGRVEKYSALKKGLDEVFEVKSVIGPAVAEFLYVGFRHRIGGKVEFDQFTN